MNTLTSICYGRKKKENNHCIRKTNNNKVIAILHEERIQLLTDEYSLVYK